MKCLLFPSWQVFLALVLSKVLTKYSLLVCFFPLRQFLKLHSLKIKHFFIYIPNTGPPPSPLHKVSLHAILLPLLLKMENELHFCYLNAEGLCLACVSPLLGGSVSESSSVVQVR